MEIFKIIKEYPLYSISTYGRIRKNSNGKMLTPSSYPDGYVRVNLFTCDGRRKKELVHRLVALTFIPNPKRLPVVNHIDRVKHHNGVDNLEWVTQKENVDKSTLPKKIRVRCLKNNETFLFGSEREACQKLSLTQSNVSACLNGSRQKTHKGYSFELIN